MPVISNVVEAVIEVNAPAAGVVPPIGQVVAKSKLTQVIPAEPLMSVFVKS